MGCVHIIYSDCRLSVRWAARCINQYLEGFYTWTHGGTKAHPAACRYTQKDESCVLHRGVPSLLAEVTQLCKRCEESESTVFWGRDSVYYPLLLAVFVPLAHPHTTTATSTHQKHRLFPNPVRKYKKSVQYITINTLRWDMKGAVYACYSKLSVPGICACTTGIGQWQRAISATSKLGK